MSVGMAGYTDMGPDAEINEDSFLARNTTDGGALLIVCDGMGGMGGGDVASREAVNHLERTLAGGGPHSVLRAALTSADMHLRRTLVDPGDAGRPGCTAVVATIKGSRAWIAWAGDARAYHVREGRVEARTRDHKVLEDLVDSGTLSRDEASRSALGHVVTRCLGGRRSDQPPHEPETLSTPWKLQPGDVIVLCSDGITDVLDDADVAELVSDRTAEEAVSALVNAALRKGTTDNSTAVVATWKLPKASRKRTDTPTARQAPPRAAPTRSAVRDPLMEIVADPVTAPPRRITSGPVDLTPIFGPAPIEEPPERRIPTAWIVGGIVVIVLASIVAAIVAWWLLTSFGLLSFGPAR